ncbi:MAG: hypothetical protein M1820_001406 [Bogoriella megaspora]|nr:MAG: hypothetical protein M1820_001406 [Bogoriella megaspora]
MDEDDRRASWRKPPIISEILKKHDRIIPSETAMAISFGRVYIITGFIIAQNIPRTFEMLDAWNTCPEPDSKYENCTEFRRSKPWKPPDQGVMGKHIRHDFDKKGDIKELLCDEANDYPESHSGCKGHFIRHFWTSKQDMLLAGVAKTMVGSMFENQHRQLLHTQSSFVKNGSHL